MTLLIHDLLFFCYNNLFCGGCLRAVSFRLHATPTKAARPASDRIREYGASDIYLTCCYAYSSSGRSYDDVLNVVVRNWNGDNEGREFGGRMK